MDATRTAVIRPALPVSLPLTLGPLRHGPRDPTVRLGRTEAWWATRTPSGPATLRLLHRGGEILAEAWGPGAEDVVDRAPDLLGAREDRTGWEPGRHPLVRRLDRLFTGLRPVATRAVLEAAVPVVIEQKVTSREAHAAWARLVRAWGEPAPGPLRLLLPPPPARLATEPYHRFHRFGLERRRVEVIRRLASRATRVEEASRLPVPERRARLEAFPGVGIWTSAEVAAVAWADTDAVAVGDYHLAPAVVHAFTGRRGGDDDAMLELLEPFRPHRGRVGRLILLGGFVPPARAPGRPLRDIRRL